MKVSTFGAADGRFLDIINEPDFVQPWRLHYIWKNVTWQNVSFANIDEMKAFVIKGKAKLEQDGFDVNSICEMLDSIAIALETTGEISLLDI